MSYQGYILVVDDKARWRNMLKDILTEEGFRVDTAATAQEAQELLSTNLYHLCIFDIRLEDTDQDNTDGMELLSALTEQGLGGAIKAIVLSAYGTKEQMREAFREHDVADFEEKQKFNDQNLLKLVNKVFTEEIQINLALKLLWQDVAGPRDVVCNMKVSDGKVTENSELQELVAAELNDLLCRLFYQADCLLVRPLTPGYSGTGVLWTEPEFTHGPGQGFIVKFGDYKKIAQEYHNFEQYVQSYLGGTYTTTIIRLRRTPRLGGIVYSFLGAENDQLESFGSFYRRETTTRIKAIVDYLFQEACEIWYANKRLRHWDLQADYQKTLNLPSTRQALEEEIKARLTSVQWGDTLYFRVLDETRPFRNPLQVMPEKEKFYQTYVCITHGDMNENNILIDQTDRTWLIDFQNTRQAHILRDVVKLDTVVRIELLTPENATLAERLAMEESLTKIIDFSESTQGTADFSTTNPALAKAHAVSNHLRALAQDLIGRSRTANFDEYYLAAYYQALKTASYESLSLLQREHALLSASLLADQLGL